MTRFNYRQNSFERFVGRRPTVYLDDRMRAPAIAILASIIIAAAVAAIEMQRLALLNQELQSLHDRIALVERSDARVEGLSRTVRHLRDLRTALSTSHRETLLTSNHIVSIGNQLPSRTWLTRVQTNRAGMLSIAGRSASIERIAEMLTSIAHLSGPDSARLISINSAGSGRLLDFLINWEPPQ